MNRQFFLLVILVSIIQYSCSQKKIPDYKDCSLSAEKRADDLISRMNLDEKVAQTLCLSADMFVKNGEPDSVMLSRVLKNGIGQIRDCWSTGEENTVKINNWIQKFVSENTRLGIPVIIHGEGLHGFVGDHATSFPQAIALSGTWNLDLIDKVYSIAANEARSRGIQQLLSPVLDVARDPRWGSNCFHLYWMLQGIPDGDDFPKHLAKIHT